MQVRNESRIFSNGSAVEKINRQFSNKNNVSFTSLGTLENQIIQEIAPGKSKLLELFCRAGRKSSEIVNIIVNNIGTALVAPIFIAFNPFSKQDKDTKSYSAMRQPISAVLAVASQFGINQTFNKFMDKQVSEGGFKHLDLSAKPKEAYIRSIIMKENPTADKETIDTLVKKRIEETTANAVKKQKAALKGMNADDLFKQLDINPAELGKINAENEAFAKELAVKCGYNKDDEKAIKAFIKELRKKGESFLVEKGHNVDELKANLAVEQLAKKLGLSGDDLKAAVNTIKENGGAVKLLEKLGLNVSEKIGKQTAENVLEKIGIELGKSNLLEKAAKAIVNNKINFTESRLKAVKIFTGIGLSLLTLPPTCSLLNWLYPRFMEKFFPNLANSKPGKGGK